MKHKIIFVLLLLVFISCKNPFAKKSKIENTKYREKSPIEILHINSSNGDIQIVGWNEKLIEIESIKKIESGLSGDLKFMDITFKKNERELFITTKIPTRINGKIDMVIYLPFTLLKIFLNSNEGNIEIDKYLGDIELTKETGEVNLLFQGDILRINSNESKLNIDIKTFCSADIIINNDNGYSNINIGMLGDNSFMDIKSGNGDIETYISEDLSYKFSAINKKIIDIDFPYDSENRINGTFSYINGIKNKNKNNISIDVSNNDGSIIIKESKKKSILR